MARAVYSNADIYLFDDTLSLVDNRVANKIFKECIQKHLQNKLRVLVTHRMSFIKKSEKVLLVEKDKPCKLMSSSTLRRSGINLKSGELLK